MFDFVSQIDIGHPEAIGSFYSAYVGVARGPEDRTFIYSGSATSAKPAGSLVGEAARMYYGHEQILSLGHREIVRRRAHEQTGAALYIHERMTAPGASRFFISMTRYPVKFAESIDRTTTALAILAENYSMILLGSYARGEALQIHNPDYDFLRKLFLQSRTILDLIRPASLPHPQWQGAKKMLPLLQCSPALWNLSHRANSLSVALKARLLDHFLTTRAEDISGSVRNKLLSECGLPATESSRLAVRQGYAAILKDFGLEYETRHRKWLRTLAILWIAIITQAKRTGLVSNPRDDCYTIQEDGLDWGGVSRLAQSAAPPESKDQYTKNFCYRLFYRESSRYFNQQMLYWWNWDRVEGEFSLLSCSRKG